MKCIFGGCSRFAGICHGSKFCAENRRIATRTLPGATSHCCRRHAITDSGRRLSQKSWTQGSERLHIALHAEATLHIAGRFGWHFFQQTHTRTQTAVTSISGSAYCGEVHENLSIGHTRERITRIGKNAFKKIEDS